MSYETFSDTMTDILSSGNGLEFTNWHKKQLKSLFSKIPNKTTLVQYLNTFYLDQEPHDILDGELDTISDLIGGTYKTVISFEFN